MRQKTQKEEKKKKNQKLQCPHEAKVAPIAPKNNNPDEMRREIRKDAKICNKMETLKPDYARSKPHKETLTR